MAYNVDPYFKKKKKLEEQENAESPKPSKDSEGRMTIPQNYKDPTGQKALEERSELARFREGIANQGKNSEEYWNTEGNPEVREAFEAKYGKGNTFGYKGQIGFKDQATYNALSQEQKAEVEKQANKKLVDEWKANQSGFNKIPIIGTAKQNIDLLGKDRNVLNAMSAGEAAWQSGKLVSETAIGAAAVLAVPAIFGAGPLATGSASLGSLGAKVGAGAFGETAVATATKTAGTSILGKTILGVSVGKLAGTAALGIAGTDAITNWLGIDNIISQDSILVRDMKSNFPYATPQERTRMLEVAEKAQQDIKLVKDKINLSTMINPLNWAFRKMWLAGLATAERAINENLDYMKYYDPLADQRSPEAQRAKYGS